MKDLLDAVGDLPQRTARTIELIQVAAVAVANIEIEMFGQSDAGQDTKHENDPSRSKKTQVSTVLDLVAQERYRQDELWGPQSGDPLERLFILVEEVGEVAEEVEQDPNRTGLGPYEVNTLMKIIQAGQRARVCLDERAS